MCIVILCYLICDVINFEIKLTEAATEVFCQKSVRNNFAKFKGKHLGQSLFFNKVEGLSLQLY